jgi:hypothetical protein
MGTLNVNDQVTTSIQPADLDSIAKPPTYTKDLLRFYTPKRELKFSLNTKNKREADQLAVLSVAYCRFYRQYRLLADQYHRTVNFVKQSGKTFAAAKSPATIEHQHTGVPIPYSPDKLRCFC